MEREQPLIQRTENISTKHVGIMLNFLATALAKRGQKLESVWAITAYQDKACHLEKNIRQ
jgi:hypothetical protein